MAKRKKLKSQVYYILVAIIILVVGVFYGLKKYEEYKYKQTFEYKLLEHGYSENEVDVLLSEFKDENDLNYFLDNKVNTNYIDLVKEKYYLKKNFYKYVEYMNSNKKLDLTTVVRNINIHLDQKFYSTDYKTNISDDTLMLVNKYYALDESYTPGDLVTIPQKYAWGDKGAHKIRNIAYEAFLDMWNAANNDGFYLMVNSSYRTYEEQDKIYNRYKNNYGQKYADDYAARPGHSEHQTGLTLDLFSKTNSNKKEFTGSNEEKWLQDNAYKYGFIQRYPEDKIKITGYDHESWHFRYVGVEAATICHDNDLTYEEYYAYYIEK